MARPASLVWTMALGWDGRARGLRLHGPALAQLAPDRGDDLAAPQLDLAKHGALVEIAKLRLQRDVRRLENADLLQHAIDHLIDAADRQILAHRLQAHVVGAGFLLDQVAIVALGAPELQAFRQAALEARIVEIGEN